LEPAAKKTRQDRYTRPHGNERRSVEKQGMSANKVLELAEKQGFLEPKVIAELKRQVSESKFVVTPEAIAKVLVDHGHLTPFQARKLVATAMGQPQPEPEPPKPASPPRKAQRDRGPDDLGLADDSGENMASAGPEQAEEDLVMLEAVEPAPTPPPRPAEKSSKSKRERKEARFSAPSQAADMPGVTKTMEEGLAELESVPTPSPPTPKPAHPAQTQPPPAQPAARSRSSSSWKTAAAAPAAPAAMPVEGLTPLQDAAPARPAVAGRQVAAVAPKAAASGLAPLDDFTADPLALPGGPLSGQATVGVPLPYGKKKRNVWDSPLLLVGGGLLGFLLVVGAFLALSLTRGTAAEHFAKAEDEYRNGSYSSALAAYDSFLERYPDNPNSSLAKVRRGMAELRQVTDGGQNPKQGLLTAQRILPEIENEEKFNEARVELAAILPEIADGFASIAGQAKETKQKEDLLAQADEALKLVNNTAYLPPSLRKERENKISAILDKLKVAQRSIEQDKDLAVALEQIATAEGQGDAAAAYQVRADLLKLYPGLDAHGDLQAAIRLVGDKERELVKVAPESIAAVTEDIQPTGTRLVLTSRQGPDPAAKPASVACIGLEGAVYGIDGASGRILWHRHVGYESQIPPQPVARDAGADVLVVDARKHELMRLAAATGKLVWKQAIGQPFFAPVVAGERVFVTTAAGKLLQFDVASGTLEIAAQLPQEATTAAALDARQSRLVQLGRHSTLFVHSSKTLDCIETYYLGHQAGAVLVPPVALLDHVIAVESPADDHTLLHVLGTDAESKRLREIGKPFRLRGRVVMPLAVTGRRVVAMTDLGDIAVYEVDAADKQQPVRFIAGLDPTEKAPALGFYTADGNRLWLASRRCTMFEIQPAVQNLARKWSQYQDDAFVAPLTALGEVLIHVRRRPGLPGLVIGGSQPATGTHLWETHIAAPLAGLLPSAERKAVDAVSTEGRVFSLNVASLPTAVVDAAAFPLSQDSAGSIWPEIDDHSSTAAWSETQAGGQLFAYNTASGSAPAGVKVPDEAAAATGAIVWGKNLVVPVASGKVELLDPATGKRAALPFQPPLSPDLLPPWTRPTLTPDGSGVIIGDGRSSLFRLTVKDQPQPHLAVAAEQSAAVELHGSLTLAGDTIYALSRSDAGEAVVAIDPQSLEINQRRWPLVGRPLFQLHSVGGFVFAATEADGLLCLEGGSKLRWQRPLTHGPLSGPPVAGPQGELLLLHLGGMLSRVSAETGEETAAVDLGEPLGGVACVVGEQVFVGTSDGGVIVVPLPQ
jgi:outer membrane protein assembly factor BamB/TolA-binding protein